VALVDNPHPSVTEDALDAVRAEVGLLVVHDESISPKKTPCVETHHARGKLHRFLPHDDPGIIPELSSLEERLAGPGNPVPDLEEEPCSISRSTTC
jgi:hypothetical protein